MIFLSVLVFFAFFFPRSFQWTLILCAENLQRNGMPEPEAPVFFGERRFQHKIEKSHASSNNCPMLLLFPSNKFTLTILLLALGLGEEAGILLHIFLEMTSAAVSGGIVPSCWESHYHPGAERNARGSWTLAAFPSPHCNRESKGRDVIALALPLEEAEGEVLWPQDRPYQYDSNAKTKLHAWLALTEMYSCCCS